MFKVAPEPLTAGKAQEYHVKEFIAAEKNYWKEHEQIPTAWQGQLVDTFGLKGDVQASQFSLLSEGQHPVTGQQLIQHRDGKEYTNAQGETVKPLEHRAAWDATFSAPKSVSLTALVGGDNRVREAHREAVSIALTELERYTQARLGGNRPAETTGRFLVAKFEHDTARPVDGYAAPQLHTHTVIFNMTTREDGSFRALQSHSYYASQQFATAVYQAELMYRLRNLGYEIQAGKSGAPEIKGYTQEYLDASSLRRQKIEEEMQKRGQSGPEAAQFAAFTTRDRKQHLGPEETLAAHRKLAEEYGNQPEKVIAAAQERIQQRGQEQTHKPDEQQQRVRESVSFAKARNFEREAVTDDRGIMRDALRRGMGDVTYAEIRENFRRREAMGEFLKVDSPRHYAGQRYTTRDMLQAERSNIEFMKRGQSVVTPIMSAENARSHAAEQDRLNPAQRRVVEEVLTTADRVHGLQGYAGSGKTESLRTIRAGAEAEGFIVEGFAPTNRAANQLREAGINAETLQRFLARATTGETAGDPASRHLYMVDESSLTSTKQMQAFMEKLGPQDRVLLIGDIRQHQGVDAGKPFEQLQAEGMRTSQLDQIMRQKEQPELLRAVELLSQNRTVDGVQLLQEQGRVQEFSERPERIAAIARAYVAQPESTLVISPDNASRIELNQAIRAELRGVDGLRGIDREFAVLMPRSDLSSADRVWAAQYQPGDVLQYTRGSKELGLEPYSYATVRAVDTKLNQISVEREDGAQVSYDPKRLQGITAYREVTREFAEGDRIQFTTNNRELQIANRQLGTIESVRPHEMTVRVEGQTPRSVTFDPQQMRHFDHGYAVTSHSSQGLTADRVLINVEVSAHRDLINQRFAYVAVSRAAHDVRLYTDNAARLTKDLSRDVSKTAALELSQPKAEQQRGETMTYRKEHAEGMQPYQPTSHVPPSIYATSIDRETVLTDLRWSQEQAKNGVDPAGTARAIAERHVQGAETEQNQRALIERYAERVAELAYKAPDMPVERQAAQLEPTAEEKRHWEPLVQSIGLEHTEPFAWRKEHAEIQSYRSDENRGWLHIDSHGQFFDRNAQPIAAQVALEPFGLSASVSRGNEQSAGMNKETPTDSGYGISL